MVPPLAKKEEKPPAFLLGQGVVAAARIRERRLQERDLDSEEKVGS